MTQPSSLLGVFETVHLGIQPIIQCKFHTECWSPHAARQYGVDIPAHIQGAVPKRLSEFIAGRALARKLLAEYGCEDQVGHCVSERMPLWPSGFIGSITHSNGIAACTVLPRTDCVGVGVDIEHWIAEKTAMELAASIWTNTEAEVCSKYEWNPSKALTLVFSAKESLFKALYPQCREFFDFFGAEVISVTGSRYAGRLRIKLMQSLSPIYTRGRVFCVEYKLLQTGVMTGLSVGNE